MFQMIYLEEIDSTNSYVKRNINNLTTNSLIYTFNQKSGYGQQKATWNFSPNKDLACSFFIKPRIKANKLFLLSMITSLAVLKTLKNFCNEEIKIKWPNDILINNKKVSGILIENQFNKNKIATSIIGIGINVNSSDFGKVKFPATSLFLECNKLFELEEILWNLSVNFDFFIKNTTNIKDEYLSNLWRYKEKNFFRDKNGFFEGEIIDIAEAGELLIQDSGGNIRKYFFKEVEFVL